MELVAEIVHSAWRPDYKKEDALAVDKSIIYGNDGSLRLTDGGRLAVCVI